MSAQKHADTPEHVASRACANVMSLGIECLRSLISDSDQRGLSSYTLSNLSVPYSTQYSPDEQALDKKEM